MAFDGRLGAAFGFDEADLIANQRGALSDEQQRLIANTVAYAHRRSPALTAVAFAVSAVLVVLAAAVVAGSGGSPGQFAVVLGVCAGFGLLVVVLRRRVRARAVRMLAAQPFRVEGPAAVSLHSSGGASGLATYRVDIGGVRFLLDREQSDAFVDGAPYRVFAIEGLVGPTVLSAERL